MRNIVKREKNKRPLQKESIRRALFKVYERFVKIRGQPKEIALGFALGIFIGMTPTMGAQIPIAIFLAAFFKWSKIAATFGVWITNPITAPFIYGVNYTIGAKLMGLEPAMKLPESLTWGLVKKMLQKAPRVLGALTVGGSVIGLPLAVLSYYLSYTAIEKYQMNIRKKLAQQKARLAGTKEKIRKRISPKKVKKERI